MGHNAIMAAEFIGSLILVTLKSPPDAQVRGVVAHIEQQKLILHDGKQAPKTTGSLNFT